MTFKKEKWYYGTMPLYIRTITKGSTSYRVSIPMELIDSLGWRECEYVFIKQIGKESLIIKSLEAYGNEKRPDAKHKDGLD